MIGMIGIVRVRMVLAMIATTAIVPVRIEIATTAAAMAGRTAISVP